MNFIQRTIPADALKPALAFSTGTAKWIEQAIRMVFALQISGDFSAKKATCDRVVWVAA